MKKDLDKLLSRTLFTYGTVLFVVFAIFWCRGRRKWKKSQADLDYKTMKATLREERKV